MHPERGAPPRSGGPDSITGGRRVVDAADLEALLAAALIRRGVDAGAEQRAVAAFLAAREAGALGARTRRRDDWRTRRGRLGRHSLKATLSVLVAGLTLSGVAVAGIGAAGSSTDEPAEDVKGTHAPSPGTTGPSAGDSAGLETGSGLPGRPGTAGDTEAHCRAYDRVRGRGGALDSTAWKRLVEAAGGAANVDAYCAERPAGTGTARRPEKEGDDSAGQDGNGSGARNGNGSAGRNGNGSTGNGSDNATRNGSDNATRNGSDSATRGGSEVSGGGRPGKPEKSDNSGAGRP
ncbi:hypothetical protein [Streptomyces sp. NRRL S-37]|uniref:hypothetical protein n=1 Tax=Streptomyces sp. NRRL S-37 TaxID=1463903 RepID=UPI0018FE5E41|nr:hypothetical protein [Streptomyces sp. NRRL S-37]